MIGNLKKLLPIPITPIDIDESILQTNIAALKTDLPRDFIEYSRVYGSGGINVKFYTWEVCSAFRPSFPGFVADFFTCQAAFRDAMETFDIALGLYPEKGGLLPFGVRDDVYFTWKTDGSPDKWKVTVIWTYEQDGYQSFDLCFLDFLEKLLTRKIEVVGFRSTWNAKSDISFRSEVFQC